uniref:Transcriptional regulator n=1 Tax=Streptococcus suis TaxID=1307 RepID=A0A6G6AVW1_STRSU|nr:transcriptional regulator [Streptococcus suis]
MISLKNLLQIYFPFLILTMLERGEVALTADVIVQLSKLYNVSTDYLLGLTDCPDRIKLKIK